MPHVVTQSCCADASCVVACPVNCIHPGPTDEAFATAEQVYIDPNECVDCGACVSACPVDAIKPHTKLTADELPFLELNAGFFATSRGARPILSPMRLRPALETGRFRVAIVGAGPAGLYTADELLRHAGVTVDVLERLDRPHGLARYGVAPDHRRTRKVSSLFEAIAAQPGFTYRLGEEVGVDVTLDQLRQEYDAVVYAVGASTDRTLGIPGEELPGSISATSLVGWYNGHPDHRDLDVDLSGERVIVVGNGNVALDVARMLTADPESLASTDISPAALAVLRRSAVREVLVLGRRGPTEAAFTLPELIGLAGLDEVDVRVEGVSPDLLPDSPKARLIAELAQRVPRDDRRRIVLRFRTAPVRVLGTDRVTGLEVAETELVADGTRAVLTDRRETIPAGLVLRSIGYRGLPVPGLPYDDATGTVPNEGGRVEPGVYVAGWVKRGPNGFLGTNKSCAEETVTAILEDVRHSRLAPA